MQTQLCRGANTGFIFEYICEYLIYPIPDSIDIDGHMTIENKRMFFVDKSVLVNIAICSTVFKTSSIYCSIMYNNILAAA